MMIRYIYNNIYALLLVFAIENILLLVYFTQYESTIEETNILHLSFKINLRKLVKENENIDKGYQTQINSSWLANHPIYKKYNYMKERKVKKVVTILVMVLSAPSQWDRRTAVRETWWPQCVLTREVTPECIFMTDYQGPNDPYFREVREEQAKYKDLHFHHNVSLGNRFISNVVYAIKQYSFDYFLRMDDDYFFCLQRFLNELPTPMMKEFHWGWVHRNDAVGMKRPGTSVLMLSRDVIERFLLQDPNLMLCHPQEEQMIALWVTSMELTHFYRHDHRIHDNPPVGEVATLQKVKHVCNSYIAIRGTYPDEMKILWAHRGIVLNKNVNLTSFACHFTIKEPFDWTLFEDPLRYQPKLCIKYPTWVPSKNVDSDITYTDQHAGNRHDGFRNLNNNRIRRINTFRKEFLRGMGNDYGYSLTDDPDKFDLFDVDENEFGETIEESEFGAPAQTSRGLPISNQIGGKDNTKINLFLRNRLYFIRHPNKQKLTVGRKKLRSFKKQKPNVTTKKKIEHFDKQVKEKNSSYKEQRANNLKKILHSSENQKPNVISHFMGKLNRVRLKRIPPFNSNLEGGVKKTKVYSTTFPVQSHAIHIKKKNRLERKDLLH